MAAQDYYIVPDSIVNQWQDYSKGNEAIHFMTIKTGEKVVPISVGPIFTEITGLSNCEVRSLSPSDFTDDVLGVK